MPMVKPAGLSSEVGVEEREREGRRGEERGGEGKRGGERGGERRRGEERGGEGRRREEGRSSYAKRRLVLMTW